MSENKLPIRVIANDFHFSFDPETVDKTDIIRRSAAEYHLVMDQQSVSARVLESDGTGKKLKVEVEGETFHIEIKDALDQVLDNMGFSKVSSKHIKEIKAPMPGLVIGISVQEGQEVKEGDRILVLEAMKMENSILIHNPARIKRIAVQAGQAVEKGQVLVELD